MARYFPAALAALTALMLTAPACSRAQTAALTLIHPINTFTYTVDPQYQPAEFGYRVTVANNASVPVYGLGFYSPLAAGLTQSHAVGIFDAGGNLLVQGVVSAGTGSSLFAGYRYTSQLFNGNGNPLTAPFTLGAGVYAIEGLTSTPLDQFVYTQGAADLSFVPNVSYASSYLLQNIPNFTLSAAGLHSDTSTGYFAANFLTSPFPMVPEPGASALLAGGLAMAGMTWRRLRRKPQPAA